MQPPPSPRLFASLEIAHRLERAEASLIAAGATTAAHREAASGAFAIPVAGGIAAFASPGSPLNKVVGLGFEGLPSEEAWAAVEAAYARHGTPVQIELSTLGDPALAAFLTGRGYVLAGFENVVGRWISQPPTAAELVPRRSAASGTDEAPGVAATITVEVSPLTELDPWIDVVVTGFAAPDTQGVTSGEEFPRQIIADVMHDLAQAQGFTRYLARRDGAVAGGASARYIDGVAQLNGAATLPSHRRRGVQSALLAARLADAHERGCELAVATTQPGSKSQQNLQGLGFDLLYARAVLVRQG